MAKVIIEIDTLSRPFKDGDILVYNAKTTKFVPIQEEMFLRKTTNSVNALKTQLTGDLADFIAKQEKEFAEMKKSLESFKNGVNDKLKDYHNILQNITKGE